jgi:hypothetical protein
LILEIKGREFNGEMERKRYNVSLNGIERGEGRHERVG